MASTPDTRPDRSGGEIGALVNGYQPPPGIYDELIDPAGEVRAHWRPLLEAFADLGPDGLQRRFAAADQALASSGAFYRVYDDAGGADRAYSLSHVPVVISADDWATISTGLKQRADLIEAILSDVYGGGDLIDSGLIPGSLVAGSPEYLRPLVGVQPRLGRHLTFYAADIGRDALGNWWVLRDRTQAPSGSGYALENRIALSSGLGEIYSGYGVERLAGYFSKARTTLSNRCEAGDAGVCLLSPGPLNETYFEHVYLARYLGFRLIEGQDLTVQNDRVYLRTVQGLRPVNVVVRRIDADFADPIELATRSQLGVAGLVSALRGGNVALANSLGSGLIEGGAFLSFLPALSRHILGERLAMPNVATWWCGQPAERALVLSNLDELTVASAFSQGSGLPAETAVLNSNLDDDGLARLRRNIELRGVDYVGLERVHLSTTPVWTGSRLEPRPFVLRVFLVASDDGWDVMPGGLALVGDHANQTILTMQRGAKAADAWVLAPPGAKSDTISLLPDADTLEIRRASGALPSRAADNLFWFGRYLERAEMTLRIVRALSSGQIEAEAGGGPVAGALSDVLFKWGAAGNYSDVASTVRSALADFSMPASVARLLDNAHAVGSIIRNRFPQDGWRALVDAQAVLATFNGGEEAAGSVVLELLRDLSVIRGIELDGMNRLAGWRFMKLGTRIERAILVCRLVRYLAPPGAGSGVLAALLEIDNCQITYRVRYPHGAARRPVLDLVLLDESNPRGLIYAVQTIADHARAVAQLSADGTDEDGAALLGRLVSAVAALDIDALEAPALIGVENMLMQLSDHITARYFDLSGARGKPS